MGLKVEFFSAYTNAKLTAAEVYLPLDLSPKSDLLALLPNADDYIYLSLKDDTNFETVKVSNQGGVLLMERGLGGTAPVAHPFGTCISTVSPTVVETIKDLICSHTCCEDDCPCELVEYSGQLIPKANVGIAWEGTVIFKGSMPMHMGVNGAPAWMKVVAVDNVLKLSGTPDMAGATTFSAAATNCNGAGVASTYVTVTVTN